MRISETDADEYALRTFYCHGRFGPMALMALGIDHHTKTEGLDLATARALGQQIEDAVVAMNSEAPRRRRAKD